MPVGSRFSSGMLRGRSMKGAGWVKLRSTFGGGSGVQVGFRFWQRLRDDKVLPLAFRASTTVANVREHSLMPRCSFLRILLLLFF